MDKVENNPKYKFSLRYMEFSEFCYNDDRLKYIQKQDSLSKMPPPLTYMKNKK